MDFKITQARAWACPDRIGFIWARPSGFRVGPARWFWVSIFRTQVEACVGLKPNPQMTWSCTVVKVTLMEQSYQSKLVFLAIGFIISTKEAKQTIHNGLIIWMAIWAEKVACLSLYQNNSLDPLFHSLSRTGIILKRIDMRESRTKPISVSQKEPSVSRWW